MLDQTPARIPASAIASDPKDEEGQRRQRRRGKLQPGKQAQNQGREQPDGNPARHPAEGQADEKLAGADRRHQQVDDVALHLGNDKRGGAVGKGVLKHRHHHQPGNEKGDEADITGKLRAVANGDGEHHQEQHRGDNRRHDSLHADLGKALHFTKIQGLQANPVDAADLHRTNRRGRAGIALPDRCVSWRGRLLVHAPEHRSGTGK